MSEYDMDTYHWNDNEHRYDNPWAAAKNFVALGTFTVIGKKDLIHYDIYALEGPDKFSDKLHNVSLGARCSDEESDYLSGSLDQGWRNMPDYPIHVAARRYVEYLLKKKNT